MATIDEALELRAGGSRGPILVLYPVPPALVRRRPAWASRSPAATDRPWPRRSRGRRSAWIPSGRWRIHLEVETGLGRGGLAVADSSRRRAYPGDAGPRPGRGLDPFQAVEDAAITAAQLAALRGAAAAIAAAAGLDLPPRHVAASAALLTDGIVAYDGVRPGLAIYGLVPDELEPSRARHGRPGAAAAGPVAARPAGPGRGPAGRPRHQLRPTFRTARPSRIATLPAGLRRRLVARRCRTGPSALVRGRRVPLVGNVAMDAVMADVTDVPGRRSTRATSSCSSAAQGEERIVSRRWRGAHHELVGGRHRDVPPPASGVPCRGGAGRSADAHRAERVGLGSDRVWNGDICELEVDAIVNAANLSLWMSTGVGGALKRAGGDAIEFAAVRQAPVPLGGAIVTPAGNLAAKAVIHAVSLDRDRRTSGPVIDAAVRSAMARAREIGATSIAFPALGTGVGGFPLDEAARITVEAVRDELRRCPDIAHVIFALRGAAAYQAFERGAGRIDPAAPGDRPGGRRMSLPYEATEEQRDELVEQVAREIQMRGLTGPAVHFLEASRPYRAARRQRHALLRSGAARRVRGRPRLGQRDPGGRHRHRAAHRPARGVDEEIAWDA